MPSAAVAEVLQRLRSTVAEFDAPIVPDGAAPALCLGAEAIDAALGGGLAYGALHELVPAQPRDSGAAAGFALALAALIRKDRPLVWVQTDFARMESGALYGPGLDLFGLALPRLLMVTVPRAVDVLWAMEEALAQPCHGDRRGAGRHRRRDGDTPALAHRARRRRLRSHPAPAFVQRQRGGDALGNRGGARRARPLRRPWPHRLRCFAHQEPPRPLRPLAFDLGPSCVRLPPGVICRCG